MIQQKIILTSNDIGLNDISIKWLANNFEKISVGQPIVEINAIDYCSNVIKCVCTKRSEYEGLLCIVTPNNTKIEKLYTGDIILGYIADDISNFKNLFICEPLSYKDTLTNQLCINWAYLYEIETIGIPLSANGSDNLYLSCSFHDNKFYIDLYFRSLVLKVKKGDTISFLFEDGKILDFTLRYRPVEITKKKILPEDNEKYRYKWTIYDYKSRKSLKESSFALSNKEIAIFATKKLSSFRITFNSEGSNYIDGEIKNKIWDKAPTSIIINNMFSTLVNEISKYDDTYLNAISDALSKKSQNISIEFDYCYVYLMCDETNGYYKIGMSNTPIYREKTLQSEKPSIRLVAYHKYPTRKFASAIELALHTVYKDKQVRGEWFNLDKNDVNTIIEGLK